MPDVVAMKYTSAAWHSLAEKWKVHRWRCRTCQACTCEPPDPAELCAGGAALRAQLTAALAAWDEARARPYGWR
jgi:hypothetical protein